MNNIKLTIYNNLKSQYVFALLLMIAGFSLLFIPKNTAAVGDAKIIIVKQTLPANSPQSFQFTANFSNNFFLAHNQTFDSGILPPGLYSASEIGLVGWDLTSATCDDGSPVNSIDLGVGEIITCTFTNTKRGTIFVSNQTDPDGATGTFFYTGAASGDMTDNGQLAVANIPPGTYTVTESDPYPNFNLTEITCNDNNSTGDLPARTATFRLEAGETITCVFTNTELVFDPSLLTFVHDENHLNITGQTAAIGTMVHDKIVVNGNEFHPPTGTVDFKLFNNLDCLGQPLLAENLVPLLPSGEAESIHRTLDTGAYSYLASYSGNARYTSAVADCEPFEIEKLNSQADVEIHNTSHENITGQTLPMDTVIHAKATVTGNGIIPILGTVEFRRFNSPDCTGLFESEAPVNLVSQVAESIPFTVATTSLSYLALFSGDANYDKSLSTCTLITPPLPTRTGGFWKTHTSFTSSIFQNQQGGQILVGSPIRKTVSDQGKLFGAYYASVSHTTSKDDRQAIDQTRIQLAKQIITAKLNCAAFICTGQIQTLINSAQQAYSGTLPETMESKSLELDAYNESGDHLPIPDSLNAILTSATPEESQTLAEKNFWDNP